MPLFLTRRQSEDWEASENCDEVCELAQQSAEEHGEPCNVLSHDGTVLYTAHPSPLCRACCESPALTDTPYCWHCTQDQLFRVWDSTL